MNNLINYKIEKSIEFGDTVILLGLQGEFKLSAKVSGVNKNGFTFEVLNGAWDGEFNSAKNAITVLDVSWLNVIGSVFPIDVAKVPFSVRREYYL